MIRFKFTGLVLTISAEQAVRTPEQRHSRRLFLALPGLFLARHGSVNEALRIVVIAPDLVVNDPQDEQALEQAERSRSLRIGLLESGFNLVATLPADVFLTERLAQLMPDMIIVDAESEARDALEHVVMATRDERRPIVMFTNDSDTSHVKDAVAAGVTAYIVAGLSSERIRPILDVAMARFQHEQALRDELTTALAERDELSAAMKDRRVIDRAKTLLMDKQGLSEEAAYARLRKTAMDKNLKLVDVAQRILDVADLLG
jgi:response regulator NasT